MSGPEEVEAPNGVRAVEHRLAGESRVRAEAGASHDVDDSATPVEVQVGAGALWVSVPDGGVEVQVTHGGSEALVTSGALMMDAGEGSDGLLVVTAGEVLLVDAAGTSQVLAAGDAAVLGADGSLAGIDQVGDDELEADPWATANRALDAEVVLPEPESEPEPVAEEPEPEPEAEEPEPEEPEPEPEPPAAEEAEPEEEPEPEPEAAAAGWVAAPDDVAPAGAELLDELYAPPEAEAHEVSGRSLARVLQIAALVIFVAVGALLVFLFKQNDDGDKGDTAIVAPTTIHNTTSTSETTSTSTSTTPAVVPIDVRILTCTQKGEEIVASGSIAGAPKTADGYRMTVVVKLGNRIFGKKTVTVPRGDDAKGKGTWTAEIPLNGDAVGSGAKCNVPKDGISLII